MLDRLLSTIAPHICSSCGAETALLCEYCFYDIIDRGFGRCIACLRPTVQQCLCSSCRGVVDYDNAWVVGERSAGLKELIDRYKFDRARAGATVLARLLAATLPQLPDGTIVTHIPSIASHRRQRGYDHMALVAKELAMLTGCESRGLLVRQTSLAQRGASKADRASRQRGAFRVDQAVTTPVLLIDDIYTTGATLDAGVAAIRAVSTQPVFIAAIARQPFDR